MRIVSSKVPFTAEETERLAETLRAFGKIEKVAFLDIETTGFSRSYDVIYLVGVLSYREGAFWLRQVLAEDYREEGRVLENVLEDLICYDCVITYNGEMFDLPFIKERAKKYRIFEAGLGRFDSQICSVDLFKHFRAVQPLFGWPNLKLKTVEACLGIGRQDPFDGGQLIDVYDEYTKTNDERLEAVLLLHNYEDIQHLTGLMKAEAFIQCLRKGSADAVKVKDRTLLVTWGQRIPLSLDSLVPLWKTPKGEEAVLARLVFTAGSCEFAIRLPSAGEALYYYLPRPEDYYFIPAENALVHRSLAGEIPGSERRKAKAEECRIKVFDPLFGEDEFENSFVAVQPPLEGMDLKTYRPKFKSKHLYAKTDELARAIEEASEEARSQYVKQFWNGFVGEKTDKGRTS